MGKRNFSDRLGTYGSVSEILGKQLTGNHQRQNYDSYSFQQVNQKTLLE